MPERGTIDGMFIMRSLQEQCHAKKFYMWLMLIEEPIDRVARKSVEIDNEKERNIRCFGYVSDEYV